MTRAEYEKKMDELRARRAQIQKEIENLKAENKNLSQKDMEEIRALNEKVFESTIESGERILRSLFPDYLMGDQGF